jgi:hypothetical protein
MLYYNLLFVYTMLFIILMAILICHYISNIKFYVIFMLEFYHQLLQFTLYHYRRSLMSKYDLDEFILLIKYDLREIIYFNLRNKWLKLNKKIIASIVRIFNYQIYLYYHIKSCFFYYNHIA